MIDCISVENMRLSDALTIKRYVDSRELMYRAAYAVYLAAEWKGSVAIVVGSGNNGGDGYALACILADNGIPCRIFTVSERLSPDSAFYADEAKCKGVPVAAFRDDPFVFDGFAILVDCLLGTGFHGQVREDYRRAIERINAAGAFVISVDINSGMNGDTGEAVLAVQSDLTVTIGYVKRGLVLPEACRFIRKLVCADIGIRLVKEEDKICSREEWDALMRKITPSDNGLTQKTGRFLPCPSWLDMEIIQSF